MLFPALEWDVNSDLDKIGERILGRKRRRHRESGNRCFRVMENGDNTDCGPHLSEVKVNWSSLSESGYSFVWAWAEAMKQALVGL